METLYLAYFERGYFVYMENTINMKSYYVGFFIEASWKIIALWLLCLEANLFDATLFRG